MRAVIDHHVDRPDVDAQQCVKLTGTNRSIGLIYLPIARSDKRIACARCGFEHNNSYFILAIRSQSSGIRDQKNLIADP